MKLSWVEGRFFRQWWRSFAFAIVTIAVLAFAVRAKRFQDCIRDRNHDIGEKESRTFLVFVSTRLTCTVRVFDAHNGTLVALFTLALWVTTQATLTHLRESTQRKQRAYLGISIAIDPRFTPTAFAPFEVMIRVWNHGRTPARNVRCQLWCEERGPELPGTGWARKQQPGGFTPDGPRPCMPGDGIGSGLRFSVSHKQVDPSTLAKTSNAKRLCVVGCVHYDDVFGGRHYTDFCGLYRPDIAVDDNAWIPHSAHNDAD